MALCIGIIGSGPDQGQNCDKKAKTQVHYGHVFNDYCGRHISQSPKLIALKEQAHIDYQIKLQTEKKEKPIQENVQATIIDNGITKMIAERAKLCTGDSDVFRRIMNFYIYLRELDRETVTKPGLSHRHVHNVILKFFNIIEIVAVSKDLKHFNMIKDDSYNWVETYIDVVKDRKEWIDFQF